MNTYANYVNPVNMHSFAPDQPILIRLRSEIADGRMRSTIGDLITWADLRDRRVCNDGQSWTWDEIRDVQVRA